ncbi:hypothetical protein BDZ91DRAFT_746996 [Kalaharituber pfeilii]|nr:hypothetical protein BDZ91DRAFT_746996 [Kalaharituber pfeilii]
MVYTEEPLDTSFTSSLLALHGCLIDLDYANLPWLPLAPMTVWEHIPTWLLPDATIIATATSNHSESIPA